MLRRELLTAPIALALRRHRLDEAVALIERQTAGGGIAAASLHVRQRSFTFERAFGKAMTPKAVFLLASITKPMTAAAIMILVDKGELALADRAGKYIPEFHGGDRDLITIRHLLTHTSGLPDMLPENTELRKRHAPLKDFVAGVYRTPLLFPPGSEVRYQSMGILLAAEIVERITRRPLREFLREVLYAPLGMKTASLGLGGRRISETMLCQVAGDDDWNWNSPYWRDLGAPWGGAHASAADVARFLEYFLKPDTRVLQPATAAAMIVNQNRGLNEPWGIGWMVKPGRFGKACSARTYGHYGSTGTVAWADPESGLVSVLLTTRPASDSRDTVLGPVSDVVSAAV